MLNINKIIAAIIWVQCFKLFAAVDFIAQSNCEDLWLASPVGLSPGMYTEGELSSTSVASLSSDPSKQIVRALQAYYDKLMREIERRISIAERRKNKDQLIDALAIRDELLLLKQKDNDLGERHIKYFIARNDETGEITGMMRVVIVSGHDHEQLDFEEKLSRTDKGELSLADNRVELGRFLSVVNHSSETPVTREILYAIATYLHERFPDNDYTIYGLTDAPRRDLYVSQYSFSDTQDLPRSLREKAYHLVTIEGGTFYRIYVGHIAEAIVIGVRERNFAKAFALLEEYRREHHLNHYGPSHIADFQLRMMQKVYGRLPISKAEISKLLSFTENSFVNADFTAIFIARALFNLLTGKGNITQAAEMFDRHVAKRFAHVFDRDWDHHVSTSQISYLVFYQNLFHMHMGRTETIRQWRRNLSREQDLFERDSIELYRFLETNDFALLVPEHERSRVMVNVDQVLEPAQANNGSFMSLSNPFFYLFKSYLFAQMSEHAAAAHFAYVARSLIEPAQLSLYEDFWAEIIEE